MKQRSGRSSLSALKLKSFSSLVKWWARMIHVTWKVTCLYGIFTGCVWMHAQIPENHWQCELTKIRPSRDKCRNTLPVYFPESLCERGLNVLNCAILGHHEYKLKCIFNIISLYLKNAFSYHSQCTWTIFHTLVHLSVLQVVTKYFFFFKYREYVKSTF